MHDLRAMWIAVALSSLLALSSTACGDEGATRDAPTPPSPPPDDADSAAPEASGSAAEERPPQSPTYFEGPRAEQALAVLVREIGGTPNLLNISVYPERVTFQIQDLAEKTKAVGFDVRGDRVGRPKPISVLGGSFLSTVFKAADTPLGEIEPMCARAIEEHVDLGEPAVTFVSIDRDLPFSRQILGRVFVEGKQGLGYVDFDKKGRFLRAKKGVPP